ncbi:MAG: hypothetical protein RL497_853 [Pseudomonadota bacterium]
MFGTPTCVITFSDAGKKCSDSSQCKGLCWIEGSSLIAGTSAAGICTENAQECKCGVEVIDGRVAAGICED